MNALGETISKNTIYFNSFSSISKTEFDAFKATHTVTPTDYYSLEAIRTLMPGLPVE